jgi:hypothetical protein
VQAIPKRQTSAHGHTPCICTLRRPPATKWRALTWVPHMRQVQADLVGAPGVGHAGHQGGAAQAGARGRVKRLPLPHPGGARQVDVRH